MLRGLRLPVRAGEFGVDVAILSVVPREVPMYCAYY
jgi:hypothetical protein